MSPEHEPPVRMTRRFVGFVRGLYPGRAVHQALTPPLEGSVRSKCLVRTRVTVSREQTIRAPGWDERAQPDYAWRPGGNSRTIPAWRSPGDSAADAESAQLSTEDRKSVV